MRRIISVPAVVSVAFLTAAALAVIAGAQEHPSVAIGLTTMAQLEDAQVNLVDAESQEGEVAGRLIVGTSGGNWLRGASGPDRIVAFGGDDALDGALGDDALYGDAGDDLIYGGPGDDHLSGGAGSDSGDDRIYGGLGADLIYGASGDDYLDSAGDVTADLVSGGAGDDLCIVGPEDLATTSGCEALYVEGGPYAEWGPRG